MRIDEAVSKLRNELEWTIVDRVNTNGPETYVRSSPEELKHYIYHAKTNGTLLPSRSEYLHELTHAYLGEKVHFQFSSSYFSSAVYEKIAPEDMHELAPIFRGTTDWFVFHKICEMCPEESRVDFLNHYETYQKHYKPSRAYDIEKSIALALGFATAKSKYGKNPKLSGKIALATKVFLSVPGVKPTIENLERLNNELLSLYTDYRVQTESVRGYEKWDLYKRKKK